MKRPRICAVIVDNDVRAVKRVESQVDLFEARLDLIGAGWRDMVRQLNKPWLACNRSVGEGGKAGERRMEELLEAAELGADIVDLEFSSENLTQIVSQVKKRAECLLSSHDLNGTPSLDELKEIVKGQLEAGADICKVVTTARSFEDNLTVLELVSQFPKAKVISFAMGEPGLLSRVLCPLVGGYFTYASIDRGRESAPGQMTVAELLKLYRMMRK